MKFTELYPVGHKLELGTVHFSAESIIRYAEKFDPQPFHLSEEGAKNSVFDGLCASGWQTSVLDEVLPELLDEGSEAADERRH